MRALDYCLRATAAGLAVLAAACAFAMVALVVLSVAMRHLAGAPFRFTEELVGLLLCATLFLALPQVTLAGSHVRVGLLERTLGQGGRKILGVLAAAVMVAFCLWFTIEALPWLEFAFRRAIKSEASRLLLYPWMATLPLSLALTGLIALYRVVRPAAHRSDDRPPA